MAITRLPDGKYIDVNQSYADILGYRREERRYTPHITLGRVKSDRAPEKLAAELAKQAGWNGGETTVRELLVMSSELTPKGPIYTVLSRPKLG